MRIPQSRGMDERNCFYLQPTDPMYGSTLVQF